DEVDRVLALHLGADDYVNAPLGLRELLARIEAVYRRCGRAGSQAMAIARAVADGEVLPSGGAPGTVCTLGALRLDQRQRRGLLFPRGARLSPEGSRPLSAR